LACRFGGEEFCVVANAGGLHLHNMLEGFVDGLRSKEFTDAKIVLTCSVGMCCQSKDSFEELIRVADNNLYEAKRLGRDRIVSDH
jgi:diguanylate cyclase (GGDEF)-like protein